MDVTGRQRLPTLLGAAGLALLLLGLVQAARPGALAERAGPWWIASLCGAALALVCGLLVRGRAATLALVVPSLVYLVVMLAPF